MDKIPGRFRAIDSLPYDAPLPMKLHKCHVFSPSLAIVVLLTVWATPHPAHADALIDQMRQVTVRVLCGNGSGSGFVIGGGEYVVTNWHVVSCTRDGGTASILLTRDHTAGAAVYRKFEQKDLAILKMNEKLQRPAATFAGRGAVEVGDKVLAIGFPGAADLHRGDESVAAGIVSRYIDENEGGTRTKSYQVTAAINPGNSGGPLFNEFGQVIGINAQKSLVPVLVIDPASPLGLGVDRVPLGEGVGWAIQVDELLSELDALHIPYTVARQKPNALMQLWYRDKVVFGGLAVAVLLSLATLLMLLTRRGREIAKHAVSKSVDYATRRHQAQSAMPTPAAAARRPVLRGVRGAYAGSIVELDNHPLAIGRDPRMCQLVMPLDTADVGRRHCVVQYDVGAGHFTLEDCWSSNGTFLKDGRRLESGRKHALRAGDGFYLSDPENSFVVELE